MIVHEKLSSGPRTGRGTMTTDRFRINLGKEAVKLALDGNWARAVELNRAILGLCPDDCEATNRLAKALMELADYSEARKILDDLLARHPRATISPGRTWSAWKSWKRSAPPRSNRALPCRGTVTPVYRGRRQVLHHDVAGAPATPPLWRMWWVAIQSRYRPLGIR